MPIRKKKGNNTVPPEEEQSTAAKKQKEPKPLPSGPVQSIIPVKNIYRGMIVTKDNRYVKIIEVLPINFTLRSIEEQDNITHLFASWLRIAPFSLQFKIITRRADTFQIINNVKAATEAETQPKCRELAKNYISFIRELSGNEALTRRFFLIIEYESTRSRQRSIDDIAIEMDEMAKKVRAGLMTCGNEVVSPTNEDFFQAEILYLFYNRKTCATEQFTDRVLRVTSDTMKMKGLIEGVDDYPEISPVDYVAPRGLDLTHPDFYICDGMYQSIKYITKDGYPSAVSGGWMSTLIEAGDGVDIDIILRKSPRSHVRDDVALKLKLNRIKGNNRSEEDTDFEEIEGAIDSARYIKACLANGEDFFTLHTFITVSSETKDGLDKRSEDISDYLYSSDITTADVRLRMEDAFQIVTPLLSYRNELMMMSARNVMTGGAASLYPFTSCEICDDNGFVLGVNRRYSSLVNLDLFNTKKYKNANMAILGTTGSGKTYATLTMALRMRIQGIQTFIIVPDKSHEFRRACEHIDGSFVRISPGSKSCINVMEIRPIVSPIAELLDEEDFAETDSWLAQKTSQLLIFFHILIPDLKNEEEQLVDEAIIKTYNLFEITHDNDSLYAEDGALKRMPIIGDLYEVLKNNPSTLRVANILGRFVTGSAQSFNQQTNVDLDNRFIVFDLSDLTGTLKAVGMFICMDFLWTKIKSNRTEKKAIFFDEGWQLLGASADARAADFVYRIFKIIRGYGGSAIFATQDISDLFAFQDGKYGKAIISNSKIKIVLGLETQEAHCVQEVLQLTKNEVRSITNFTRGEGLICVNNNKVPVFIRASALEDELITTDPQQLRQIISRKQNAQKEAAELAQRLRMTPSEPQAHVDVSLSSQCDEDLPEGDCASHVDTSTDGKVIDSGEQHTPLESDALDPVTGHMPKQKKDFAEEARMSYLAMEQLAAVTAGEGVDEPYEDDVMLRVDDDPDALDVINRTISSNKKVATAHPNADVVSDEDEDLADADPLQEHETKGGGICGEHFPSGF